MRIEFQSRCVRCISRLHIASCMSFCVHARMLCSVGSHLLCQLEKRKRAMSFKLIVICNNLYMACNVKCQCKYDQFRHDFSEEGWICDTQYFAYAVYLMCINLLLLLLNDDLVIFG